MNPMYYVDSNNFIIYSVLPNDDYWQVVQDCSVKHIGSKQECLEWAEFNAGEVGNWKTFDVGTSI